MPCMSGLSFFLLQAARKVSKRMKKMFFTILNLRSLSICLSVKVMGGKPLRKRACRSDLFHPPSIDSSELRFQAETG